MSSIKRLAVVFSMESESNQVSAAMMGKIIISPMTMITIFFWISYLRTSPTLRFYEVKTFLGSFY